MAYSLLVAELDQPNWKGALGLQADSGPTVPIVLHFSRPFSTQSHEAEGRAVGAYGEGEIQKLVPQEESAAAKDKSMDAYSWEGILGSFLGLPVVNPIA